MATPPTNLRLGGYELRAEIVSEVIRDLTELTDG